MSTAERTKKKKTENKSEQWNRFRINGECAHNSFVYGWRFAFTSTMGYMVYIISFNFVPSVLCAFTAHSILQFSVTNNIISFLLMKIVVFNLYIFRMNFSMIILLVLLCLPPAASCIQSATRCSVLNEKKNDENGKNRAGAAQKRERIYFFDEYYLIVVAVASVGWAIGHPHHHCSHFCAHSLGECVHGVISRCALFAPFIVEYYYLIKIQLRTNNNNIQHFTHSPRIYACHYRGFVLQVFQMAPHRLWSRIQNIHFGFVQFANSLRHSRGKSIFLVEKGTQKKCEIERQILLHSQHIANN